MRRDAVGEQDLEDAELEHVREAALEPLHRTARDLLERRIERPAALHRAEREVHGERALAGIHLRLLGLARERAVGVGVLVENARDHAQCERSRVAHAPVTAGSAPRRPRSQSPAGMRRPPGGWTSHNSSAPLPQPRSNAPASSARTPGAGPSERTDVRQTV